MGTAVDAAAFGSVDGVVAEVMRLHRSLPARPSLEEVEAAAALAHAADREERARLDAVSRLRRPPAVPDELFAVALEMHRALAAFQCREQKRDTTRLLELDALHALADEEEERGRRTRGDGRHVVGAPSAWTSVANWRRPIPPFPWSQAKRPIWLAVAWLKRLARQPNMYWVVYWSMVGS